MSTFKDYLTESVKSYDFKIKIAGEPKDIDKNRLETALQKFEVTKMSAGKSTPIQSLPLDFPALSNESVTIFDVTTSYPASVREMREYIADYMKVAPAMIVVRKPNEPTEEYQEQMQVAKNSEYKNKLNDVEMKDSPKVNAEDFHSSKANMSLLKELLKDREAEPHKIAGGKAAEDMKGVSDKSGDNDSPSPISTGKPAVKGNPDPASHYKFRQPKAMKDIKPSPSISQKGK